MLYQVWLGMTGFKMKSSIAYTKYYCLSTLWLRNKYLPLGRLELMSRTAYLLTPLNGENSSDPLPPLPPLDITLRPPKHQICQYRNVKTKLSPRNLTSISIQAATDPNIHTVEISYQSTWLLASHMMPYRVNMKKRKRKWEMTTVHCDCAA